MHDTAEALAVTAPAPAGEMRVLIASCARFMRLLDEFYMDLGEEPPANPAIIPAHEMPEPYRQLLVHNHDMTPTLESYHGGPLGLRLLGRMMGDGRLSRHIVLDLLQTRRPVEYGAIRIALDVLTPPARREAAECRVPLGRILHTHGVRHSSCPGAFFKIRPNDFISRELRLHSAAWLYGRCNCISDEDGRTIAEVIEILPHMERN